MHLLQLENILAIKYIKYAFFTFIYTINNVDLNKLPDYFLINN